MLRKLNHRPPIQWLSASELIPPHRVIRFGQVDSLWETFKYVGWDTSKPVLRGYFDGGKVQLLSGTHRRAAAELAGIKVPVIVWSKAEVEAAWGTPLWDRIMGIGLFEGDHLLA